MQRIHPPDRFCITYLSQINLSCFKILMPQNHLGDNLQRNPITAGIRGGIPAKIMRSDFHMQLHPVILDHAPSRAVTDWEYQVILAQFLIINVFK